MSYSSVFRWWLVVASLAVSLGVSWAQSAGQVWPPERVVRAWQQARQAEAAQATHALASAAALPPKYEVRGAWLATYLNLDWPRTRVRQPQDTLAQQRELLALLDGLKAIGTNVVLFQVRTRGAVLYPSRYEPWDVCLTGQFGRTPDYDPLAFAVRACHARGMQLHAWLVTFPLAKPSVAAQHGKQGVHLLQAAATLRTSEHYMLDPGHPHTAEYLAQLATELVSRYAIDGLHLDYVRYPEHTIRYDDSRTYRAYGHGRPKDDWRRDNVTRVVARVAEAVRHVRPWVRVSASPVGKYADTPRYPAGGWNARDAVMQDAALWLERGYMDMLFPMLYFRDNHFFPFVRDWQERSHGRTIVAGLGTYMLTERAWQLSDLTRQLHTLRRWGLGAAHFRTHFALDTRKGVQPMLAHFNAVPALVPPMHWADSVPPPAPAAVTATHDKARYTLHLRWPAVADATPITYNVYASPQAAQLPDVRDVRQLVAYGLATPHYTYAPALPSRLYTSLAVTAVDAYGNESAPTFVHAIAP